MAEGGGGGGLIADQECTLVCMGAYTVDWKCAVGKLIVFP